MSNRGSCDRPAAPKRWTAQSTERSCAAFAPWIWMGSPAGAAWLRAPRAALEARTRMKAAILPGRVAVSMTAPSRNALEARPQGAGRPLERATRHIRPAWLPKSGTPAYGSGDGVPDPGSARGLRHGRPAGARRCEAAGRARAHDPAREPRRPGRPADRRAVGRGAARDRPEHGPDLRLPAPGDPGPGPDRVPGPRLRAAGPGARARREPGRRAGRGSPGRAARGPGGRPGHAHRGAGAVAGVGPRRSGRGGPPPRRGRAP